MAESLSQKSSPADLGLSSSKRAGRRNREETESVGSNVVMQVAKMLPDIEPINIDHGELLSQLALARFQLGPYHTVESYTDPKLWFKIGEVLFNGSLICQRRMDQIQEILQYYKQAYAADPSMAWISSESLKSKVEDVFKPRTKDWGFLDYAPEPVHRGEISSVVMEDFEGMAPTNHTLQEQTQHARMGDVASEFADDVKKLGSLGGMSI